MFASNIPGNSSFVSPLAPTANSSQEGAAPKADKSTEGQQPSRRMSAANAMDGPPGGKAPRKNEARKADSLVADVVNQMQVGSDMHAGMAAHSIQSQSTATAREMNPQVMREWNTAAKDAMSDLTEANKRP